MTATQISRIDPNPTKQGLDQFFAVWFARFSHTRALARLYARGFQEACSAATGQTLPNGSSQNAQKPFGKRPKSLARPLRIPEREKASGARLELERHP